MQEIGRDSINAKGQSAFWHDRYTLRRAARDGAAAAPVADEFGGSYPGASRPREGTAAPLDVPIFLDALKDTILTTGALPTHARMFQIASALYQGAFRFGCFGKMMWSSEPLQVNVTAVVGDSTRAFLPCIRCSGPAQRLNMQCNQYFSISN